MNGLRQIVCCLVILGLASIFIQPTDGGGSCDEEIRAVCRLKGDKGVPEDQRQDISGKVVMRQRTGSEYAYVEVRIDGVEVAADALLGLHVHEGGNVGDGCGAIGGHYNPDSVPHGDRDAAIRHPGDFGNVRVDCEGKIREEFSVTDLKLSGPNSVIGRGIVLHGGQDDLGQGTGNAAAGSVANGNAGPRIACCKIVSDDGAGDS